MGKALKQKNGKEIESEKVESEVKAEQIEETKVDKSVKESEEDKTAETKKRKLMTPVEAELPEEVEKICTDLKEENKHLMKLVYDQLGLEKLKEIQKKTWETENGEGIKTQDGSRRKTPGGVFFHLAKEAIGDKFNALIKENQKQRKKQKAKAAKEKN